MSKTYSNAFATITYPEDPPDVRKAKSEIEALFEELDHGADPDDILPRIASLRDKIVRLYKHADEMRAKKIRKKLCRRLGNEKV